MVDEELKRFWEATQTGVGHPLGKIVHDTNKRTKEMQDAAERARIRDLAARQRAEREAANQPVIISDPFPTGGRTPGPTPGETKPGRLDKLVLYAAWMLAVIGFGLGVAAASSWDSWRPLIGGTIGAAVGFAIPFGLRAAIDALVDFIERNLPQLIALAVIAVGGVILYAVLS